WLEWLRAVYESHPFGSASWRRHNRVFRQDASSLLHDLHSHGSRPTVVYADPPYTRDQYSRYYHIHETLLQYDYPTSSGSGRYRPDRFQSPYSMKTRVGNAMEDLVSRCAKLGSTLVLSYPERGMLRCSTETIPALIRQHFGRPPQVHSVAVSHSSFGASKGRQKYPVRERIYVAH
ncbi:MAG: modification methylase, partial [Acidobacteria bacterium]|nr:modification methylase [Acidobacteriota bacterium]